MQPRNRMEIPGLLHSVVKVERAAPGEVFDARLATPFAVLGIRTAGEMLMRGFTTGRDVGGNSFGLKRSIDEDVVPGPRIWPAGAMISQTSGHGDYRSLHDLPKGPTDPLHFSERLGAAAIADGGVTLNVSLSAPTLNTVFIAGLAI